MKQILDFQLYPALPRKYIQMLNNRLNNVMLVELYFVRTL